MAEREDTQETQVQANRETQTPEDVTLEEIIFLGQPGTPIFRRPPPKKKTVQPPFVDEVSDDLFGGCSIRRPPPKKRINK